MPYLVIVYSFSWRIVRNIDLFQSRTYEINLVGKFEDILKFLFAFHKIQGHFKDLKDLRSNSNSN